MSDGSSLEGLGDQYERTLLSWRRTALSLVAAGLLVGHLAAADAGGTALVVMLSGVAVVLAYVWLGARPIALTGLVLVAGVLLVGATALVAVAR